LKKRSPLLSLQKAIYARLKSKLTVSVYDAVPDGAVFPYVTIGEDTAVDWSTKLTSGQEVTHTLHIWSQYQGMTEIKDLIDQVIQALTISPLDLTADKFKAIVHSLDFNETFRDPDGITRHGVLRFRFKIQDIELEV
jgi:hypothetical protein